jgi:hypothetical protein
MVEEHFMEQLSNLGLVIDYQDLAPLRGPFFRDAGSLWGTGDGLVAGGQEDAEAGAFW